MEFLTTDELLAVLKVAQEESLRDWLMILMAYNHGLRATEVCEIKVSDVAKGTLDIARLKGSRRTVQPLVPHRGKPLLDEVKGLQMWLRERPKDSGDALFPSRKGGSMTARQFNRLFHYYAGKANLPESKSNPHVLKHTAATHLIRGGMDVAKVQQRLGHSSISSTMHYVHLNDTEVAEEAQNILMEAF